MEKNEIEELRSRVLCAAVLENAGFAVDLKESTKRAVKYRRGEEIIIVIHDGKGWFDPLSDAKGDVFRLVEHLDSIPFVAALDHVAALFGFIPSEPIWTREARAHVLEGSVAERWRRRSRPWRGSMTRRYLRDQRCIPEAVLCAAIERQCLREGPHGSMWAAHTDADGTVTGWEERGPDWRGFASGGAKVLFRLGRPDALRLCVTEAAIDAMSLAALEGMREGSLYLSAGGGWSPTTSQALRFLAARPGMQFVAATDSNSQGEIFAGRIRGIAEDVGCDWLRLAPPLEDWNDALRDQMRKEQERKEGQGLPHARRLRQG